MHVNVSRVDGEQTPGDAEGQRSRRAAVHEVAKSQTRLSN